MLPERESRRDGARAPRATGTPSRRSERHLSRRGGAALVVVGLLPVALLGATWWWSEGEVADASAVAASAPSDEPVAPADGTPLLSARRTPDLLARSEVTEALTGELAPVIEGIGQPSCLVVRADGHELLDVRGDQSVVPASNMKILTAAAALDVLGPDHRFRTTVTGNVVDGVAGDLFLIGGGDPLLAVEEYAPTQLRPQFHVTALEQLADSIVAAGVRRVEGAVVGDDTRHSDERYVSTWDPSVPNTEAGPLGALLVNDGRVFPRDDLPGQDPAEAAAEQFTILLRNRGVEVAGPPRRDAADPAAPLLAAIESAPLQDVVEEMLTNSDNNTAELVLREIGLAAGGVGSREAGAAAVVEALGRWGIPTDGVVVVDGSGLDQGNRLSCDVLVAVLERSGTSGPLFEGMPVAGERGTLEDLFVGTALDGRLRAKTGTLSGAKALSGVVPLEDGAPLVFSLLINGEASIGDWPSLWTEMANAYSGYPAGPDPAEIAPSP